jgi:glucan phosphoethanolaminetransferase (alkaline phosphatase superfamily)
MKLRLTPLNIVAALGLITFVLSFVEYSSNETYVLASMAPLYRIVLGSLVLVSIITDFIFRFLFKDLKRIWLVEMVFITLTIVIFLLLQK